MMEQQLELITMYLQDLIELTYITIMDSLQAQYGQVKQLMQDHGEVI
jgi:hypothetical protein